jgi:hypothetical protein
MEVAGKHAELTAAEALSRRDVHVIAITEEFLGFLGHDLASAVPR